MSEEFEVSKIKKIRYNLYHVIFNEEIVQKFTDETMATFRVNQGAVFSKETYDEMVKNDQIKRAKSRGLDILSRSSKSKMQIKSTLKREGFCEEAIENFKNKTIKKIKKFLMVFYLLHQKYNIFSLFYNFGIKIKFKTL